MAAREIIRDPKRALEILDELESEDSESEDGVEEDLEHEGSDSDPDFVPDFEELEHALVVRIEEAERGSTMGGKSKSGKEKAGRSGDGQQKGREEKGGEPKGRGAKHGQPNPGRPDDGQRRAKRVRRAAVASSNNEPASVDPS